MSDASTPGGTPAEGVSEQVRGAAQAAAESVAQIALTDGTTIPQLGYGVFQVEDAVAQQVVETALELGYRLIDTAKLYNNETGVGAAIRASGVPRDQVYVTTKVWNDDQGYDAAMRAFDASMARLGLDQLDLLLIHWPCPKQNLYVQTWKAFVALQESGRVRSIGVSNFLPAHLDAIIEATGVAPVINQVELHPYLIQTEQRAADAERSVVTQAWSPLGRGVGLLAEDAVTSVAQELGVTPAQVVLAWHLALGNVVIPKSVTPARIAENMLAARVSLTDEQVRSISALDRGQRIGPDPAQLG